MLRDIGMELPPRGNKFEPLASQGRVKVGTAWRPNYGRRLDEVVIVIGKSERK